MTEQEYPPPIQPFAQGGDEVLLDALDERQHRHNEAVEDAAGDGSRPRAISSSEVLECLSELGMEAGYDAAATELFFGEDGRQGYTDAASSCAVITHGGFIYRDPVHRRTYAITCTSMTDTPQPGDQAVSEPATGEQHRHPVVAWIHNRVLGQPDSHPSSLASSRVPRWSVSAGGLYYEVQPRFYEDVDIMDLCSHPASGEDPQGQGLISLYPVEDREAVCPHTGTMTFDNVEDALDLARRLPQVLAEHGVLCDPRVVLCEAPDLPLLPREAREQKLYEAEQRNAAPQRLADDEYLPRSAFLGASHHMFVGGRQDRGHLVRSERSPLVPDQREAGNLAEQCSRISMQTGRVKSLILRVEDPYIPEVRKHALREQLAEEESSTAQLWDSLRDQTPKLVGLILSLIAERPQLIREAALQKERL